MRKHLAIIGLTGAFMTLAPSCCTECKQTEDNFKYLVDEFADIKVMRFRVPGWEDLTLQQKEYIYHLGEAAKYGRDILWAQNFEYNLEIRKVLEQILENYNGDKTSEEYQNLLVYAKRVFFSNGIHHHYAEDKIIPGCSEKYFIETAIASRVDEQKARNIAQIIFSADKYLQKRYTGTREDILLGSASDYYRGVTREEALKFYSDMEKPGDERPLSYGLNSRLVKKGKKLVEEPYKIGGLYGAALEKVVEELEKAREYAENDEQKRCIDLLVSYYRTADLKTWDEYNIEWVKDTHSNVDFVNGFIESYGDPLGIKASWEALVNFKNIESSKRTEIISADAQWFEDHSPVNSRFKKKEVTGVSAKVITAVTLGGDCYPASPLGINLPNANWIRKEYGSKSVTIENISNAYSLAALESPKSLLSEFAWNEEEIKRAKEFGALADNLHTDLHECLGHGSGQLLPGVSPNALGEYSSTLEEARADLFALYYIADKRMVDLGILPNDQAYKAEYDNYIRNGIFTQQVRIDLGKNLTQAHMQNRQLIAKWCFEKGSEHKVIEKKMRDGKTYFVINDYLRLRELFGDLLAEIQRIKSEGDFEAGKSLVENYGIKLDYDLHKEVLERYKELGLKPYGGFMNPEITPVTENGNVVDYTISYPDNYLEQMLEYGRKYSTL